MATVRRVGPPRPIDVSGDVFTWNIELSDAQHGWLSLFMGAVKRSSVGAGAIEVDPARKIITFKAETRAVKTMVAHIEEWIQSANAGVENERQAVQLRRDHEHAVERDKQRRLKEAQDEVKDL